MSNTMLNEGEAVSRGAMGRQRNPNFSLPIDGAQAQQLMQDLSTQPSMLDESRLDLLEGYAGEVRNQKARDMRSMYTDPVTWWKGEGNDNVADEVKHEIANRRFIANAFGQTTDQQGELYPSFRDRYFDQTFGKVPANESEAFTMLQKGVTAQQQAEQAIKELPSTLALNLMRAAAGGTEVSEAASYDIYQSWKDRHAEALSALPEDWESKAMEQAESLRSEMDTMMRDIAPEAKKVWDILQKWTRPEKTYTGDRPPQGQGRGPSQQDTSVENDTPVSREDIEGVAKALTEMPEEKQKRLLEMLYMSAEATGAGMGRGFFEKIGEGLVRGGVRIYEEGAMANEDRNARNNLRRLRSDQPAYLSFNNNVVLDSDVATGIAAAEQGAPLRIGTPQGTVPLTPEEREKLIEENEQRVRELSTLRKIRSLASGSIDPLKTEMTGIAGSVVQGAYDYSQSAGYTVMAAVPFVGFPAVTISLANSNYLRMLDEYPDIDPDFAWNASLAIGAPQAFIERFKVNALMGRSPMLNKLMKRMTDARVPLGVRIGLAYGANVAYQTGQEFLQEAMPTVADQLSAALREDMPEFDANQAWGAYVDQMPQIFYSMLWAGLIGTGAVSLREFKRDGIFLTNVGELEMVGIVGDTARDIAAEQDTDARNEKIKTAWGQRSEADIKAGIAKRAAMLQAANVNDTRAGMPQRDSVELQDGTVQHAIRDSEGNVLLKTTDPLAADVAYIGMVRQITSKEFNNETVQLKGLTEWWLTADPTRADNEQRQLRDTDQGNAQQKLEALQQANNEQGIAELHRRIAQSPYAGTPYDQIQILGEASVEQVGDMVFRSVIALNKNSRVRDAREEMHHTAVRMAVANGKVDEQTMRGWLEATERVFAEKGLNTLLPRADMTDIVESMAVVQEAFENERISADVEMSLPQAFVDYIKRMIQVLVEVLKRGKAIREALDAGVLPAEFEGFLAMTTGVSQQEIVDRSRERTEQEVGAAENYSIGISPAMDTDYLAAVERGDMEMAQRMVDEAARAAGYTIGPVYHGTPDGRFLDVDPVFRSRKDRLGFGFEANVQWFAKDRRTAETYADDRRAFDRQNAEPRTIRTFLQIANPLIVEGGNKGWREAQARGKTGNAITQAISDGHDGIVIRNVKDDYNRMESGEREQTTDTYATFSATQIKSADPVTYDASGNVIPLSQRFDATTADINYSIAAKNSLRVRMTRQAMTDAALAQESWKDWYEEHQAVLDEFFGDHAQLFQDILSITSQAASVKANVGLALRAFGLYVRGEPFDGMLRGQEKRGFLPAVIKNLERHRENDQLQGQKIRAYKASNDGEVDQAVVDRHIAQLIFGVKSPSKAQFAKAQKILSEIANEIGWTPRQVQAALWAHSIYKSGKTPQSYGDYLKQLESRGTIEQRIGDLGRRGPSGDADGGGRGRYAPDGAAEETGVDNYSISTQSEIDRVSAAMGALDRSPLGRIKVYEKMQERFLRVMSDNRETLAAMEGGDLSQVRRTQILQALGELDGIITALPAEIRAKIGGYTQLAKVDPMDVFKGDQKVSEVRGMSGAIISAWMREGLNIGQAQKKTELPAGYRADRNLDPTRADRAIADVFIQRINRINEALEKFLRDEYNDAAVELFKRAKPQRSGAGEKPKGKLGATVHELFDTLKEATEWSAEKAQAWADGQWSRIESGELNPYEQAHATLAAQVVPLFADWANADSTQRAAAVSMGKDILDRAYKGEQQRIIAQRTKRGYDRTDLSKDAGVSAEDDKARQNAVKRENSLPAKWEAAMLNLLNFDQVLRYVFGNDSKIAQRISDRQRKADNAKSDDVAAMSDEWAAFLARLGGGEMQGQQLLFDLSRMDEEIDGVAYSQNQLVAITMMWMQPKGRQHMEGFFDSDGQPSGKWHYNQGFVNKAEALLTEESKAIREYLLRKYDEEYDALNKVYRKVYGLNLPKNQFYSPLSVEPIKAPQGASIDPVTGAVFAAGANSPSALRSRGGAIAQPVFRDAVQTYFGHMLQMAHWKAYAEFNSEVSALLGHRDTRNVVKGKAGEQAATVMNNWLQYFQQGGNKDAANHLAINQWINRITGNFAAISLFGRVSTLALQVTQLGAASAKMPVGAYLSRFGKLMSGRLGWTTALDSDYIQRRIKDMPPAVALAMQGLRAEKPSQIRNAARWLGQHLSGFDGFFTAGTYAIVYDYQLSQARQNGMGGQEAADYAREAAERIVDEIAQPTRAGARSIYELNSTNPVARAVWAFSSESRKNMGLLMYNGAKGGSRNFGKALTYVLLLNGLVGIVIRNAFRDMRDDDDDEVFDEKNWGWKRLAAQFISDPIYGIPVVGETIEGGIYTAFGVYKPSGSVFDVARGVPAATRMVTQYPAQVLEGEAEFRDIVADVNRILAAAGLFNSNIAAAASISNLAKDVFEVTDNALGDE
jgi:hypothetical protein